MIHVLHTTHGRLGYRYTSTYLYWFFIKKFEKKTINVVGVKPNGQFYIPTRYHISQNQTIADNVNG